MFDKCFLVGYFISIAFAMIAFDTGFIEERKTWPKYINQNKDDVIANLSLEFPNVQFKIFHPSQLESQLEEFYFGRIKLVVDDFGIVTEAPEFCGQEPDFKPIANKIKDKKWEEALDYLTEQFPNAAIVVMQNGTKLASHSGRGSNYILLLVGDDGVVSGTPTYVRVLPKKYE